MPRPEHDDHLHIRFSESGIFSQPITAPEIQPHAPSTDTQLETTQTDTQPETSQPHDRGEIGRRGFILGMTGIGVFGYIGARLVNKDFGLNLEGGATGKPPVIEASIVPELFEFQGKFEMVTNARIGAAVGIKGHKDGPLWNLGGITKAHMDKMYFCDCLAATDQTETNETLKVAMLGDEVQTVKAKLNAFKIFQPRVDFSDYRNQLNIGADDDAVKIKKITDEYEADGSHYDKSGGFDCTICDVDAVELVHGSLMLAQFAITIDGQQPDIFADSTYRYQRNMIQQLALQHGVTEDKVTVDIVFDDGEDPALPPTPDEVKQIYKKRIKKAYDDALAENGGRMFKTLPEVRQKDDGTLIAYTELQGGAKLSVVLSKITYEKDIRDVILQKIELSNAPTTLNTTPANQGTSATQPLVGPPFVPNNSTPTETTKPLIGPPFNPQGQSTETTVKVYGPPFNPSSTSTTEG